MLSERLGIMSVVSGKGGVGKTTFSINLGAALNEFYHDNVIVDSDISNPNMALHLNIPHMPITLQDVLNDGHNIDHAIQVHHSGLKVVPSSFSMDKIKADFSKLREHLEKIKESVIVDSPSGIDDDIQHIIQLSDKVLVVTNPESSAVIDAVKVIRRESDEGEE